MPTGDRPATGLLSAYLQACDRQGWNPAADVRMQEADDALSDEERSALEVFILEQVQAFNDLTDEEFDALDALSDEDLAKLQSSSGDDQVRRLRNEAARRRKELKPWKAIARDFGKTPEEIREILEAADDDDDDESKPSPRPKKRSERPRRDTAAEDRANQKLVKAEVKAAAADLFQDPGDAHLFLDLDKYEVDEDGDIIDPDELLEDLQDLLDRKPHLAKAKERKGPKPLGGQGRRDASKSTGLDAGRERARARFGKSTNGAN